MLPERQEAKCCRHAVRQSVAPCGRGRCSLVPVLRRFFGFGGTPLAHSGKCEGEKEKCFETWNASEPDSSLELVSSTNQSTVRPSHKPFLSTCSLTFLAELYMISFTVILRCRSHTCPMSACHSHPKPARVVVTSPSFAKADEMRNNPY